jgi:hypothetical protein
MRCTVSRGMYESNDKKYLKIKLDDPMRFYKPPQKYVRDFIDPLNGDILTVKIPFRYNRVMCSVAGAKTLQELEAGDIIDIDVTFAGYWLVNGFGGPSWKVNQVTTYTASDTQAQ